MILRETIRINASPEQIWPLVADPVRMADWNPKIVAVDRRNEGLLRLGERYRAAFVLSGRERESECEVVELQEPSELVIRHRVVEWPPERYVDERYRLKNLPAGTRLVQELDFSRSGIPWLLQVLMWVIHKTGQPQGKRYLESLRGIAEQPEHQSN